MKYVLACLCAGPRGYDESLCDACKKEKPQRDKKLKKLLDEWKKQNIPTKEDVSN